MPVIKVWCLPRVSEEKLKALFEDIIAAEVALPQFQFKGMSDTTVLFPADLMRFGLGTDIVIEAGSASFATDKCSQEGRDAFARAMVQTVGKHFLKAKVECFVFPYDVGVSCGYYRRTPEADSSISTKGSAPPVPRIDEKSRRAYKGEFVAPAIFSEEEAEGFLEGWTGIVERDLRKLLVTNRNKPTTINYTTGPRVNPTLRERPFRGKYYRLVCLHGETRLWHVIPA